MNSFMIHHIYSIQIPIAVSDDLYIKIQVDVAVNDLYIPLRFKMM